MRLVPRFRRQHKGSGQEGKNGNEIKVFETDRSLSVDVSAADDFGSFQRLVLFGALAEGHDAGHFCISFISFILW